MALDIWPYNWIYGQQLGKYSIKSLSMININKEEKDDKDEEEEEEVKN